jgi:hypothetical protein
MKIERYATTRAKYLANNQVKREPSPIILTSEWKGEMLKQQMVKIEANDAILVLNFTKHDQLGYIGGATFLEMYEAWKMGKKIFVFNLLPESMLRDEIMAFQPIVVNSDLTLVR